MSHHRHKKHGKFTRPMPRIYRSQRQTLYRCPICGEPWALDGMHVRLRLDTLTLNRLAREQHADLGTLPTMLCRLCAFRHRIGLMDVDEYGGGAGGYGFVWDDPTGSYAQAAIVAEQWLATHHPVPGPILAPHVLQEVLNWLASCTAFPCIRLLSRGDAARMAQALPPERKGAAAGTWQWKGAHFRLDCSPLKGSARIILALALPQNEKLDIRLLILLWQYLALLFLESDQQNQPPSTEWRES